MEVYKTRAGDMAQAISIEMGAPIALAKTAQVGAGAGHLKNTIRAAKTFVFESPLGDHAPGDMILYEPVGVCALITPWNWPMNQVMLKVAPALAAGCTVVLKPSELSPLSAILLAETVDAAGFPPGVFNLVNGDGAGVGAHLTAHPDVDMVSFTGSTRAGVAINKAAAETVKRVSLELGGKGANIIFADADEKAVTRGVRHCFNNSGQSCNAPTRMLVERSIYDQAVEIAAEVANGIAVGPASEPGRHIGPVVNKSQWTKIQEMIEVGINEGARLVAGGPGLPEGMNRGFFVRPTVFADVNNNMTIARQEIFGPVASVIPFDTAAEAIAIANDTIYGLAAGIWTSDINRAFRLVKEIEAGVVWVNNYEDGDMTQPFGGYKQSGHARDKCMESLKSYTQNKSAWIRLTTP